MRNLPTITKNLLLINLLVWLLDSALKTHGIYISNLLGLYDYRMAGFHFWQPLTYMFMHANFSHLFCNMFAVLMFGATLEHEWGSKRFLTYYLICGIGAAVIQQLVWLFTGEGITIGASGAVFGILLAFGWLFPEVKMFLLFLPIPIRARTFVIIYAAFELMAGLSPYNTDNIAHFAHLGGMLFGLLVILWWQYVQPMLNRIEWPWQQRRTLNSEKDKDYSGYHYRRNIE